MRLNPWHMSLFTPGDGATKPPSFLQPSLLHPSFLPSLPGRFLPSQRAAAALCGTGRCVVTAGILLKTCGHCSPLKTSQGSLSPGTKGWDCPWSNQHGQHPVCPRSHLWHGENFQEGVNRQGRWGAVIILLPLLPTHWQSHTQAFASGGKGPVPLEKLCHGHL